MRVFNILKPVDSYKEIFLYPQESPCLDALQDSDVSKLKKFIGDPKNPLAMFVIPTSTGLVRCRPCLDLESLDIRKIKVRDMDRGGKILSVNRSGIYELPLKALKTAPPAVRHHLNVAPVYEANLVPPIGYTVPEAIDVAFRHIMNGLEERQLGVEKIRSYITKDSTCDEEEDHLAEDDLTGNGDPVAVCHVVKADIFTVHDERSITELIIETIEEKNFDVFSYSDVTALSLSGSEDEEEGDDEEENREPKKSYDVIMQREDFPALGKAPTFEPKFISREATPSPPPIPPKVVDDDFCFQPYLLIKYQKDPESFQPAGRRGVADDEDDWEDVRERANNASHRGGYGDDDENDVTPFMVTGASAGGGGNDAFDDDVSRLVKTSTTEFYQQIKADQRRYLPRREQPRS